MNSQNDRNKRFFIHTLGCKVNQYESQMMREALLKAGYRECLSREIADIYILNTCTVTHHADCESRHWIGLLHRANPTAKIVVTGCYTEKESENITFLPDCLILKNADKGRIVEFLGGENSYPSSSITSFEGHTKAFVKIQDGCENSCSYCKVRLVRNIVKSRPLEEITGEVRALIGNGYNEIVLVGICLGAWGKHFSCSEIAESVGLSRVSLIDALKAIDAIGGDFRIRLSSIEPRYVTDELIDYISRNKRVCPHLHIPFQSGDDEILKMMNRPYTTADYIKIVKNVRDRIKNVAITTDMLVGFPGETDAHFHNTVNFIKDIRPARAHIFTFSKRRGTAAYDMPHQVGGDVAKKRYHELWAAASMTSYIYRSGFVGQRLAVLVETKRDKHSGLLSGYSDNYIKVLFEGPNELMKKVVPIKIKDITLSNTIGEYCER